MFRALWVRRRDSADDHAGTFVRELRGGSDQDPRVPLSPYEARRLAAELVAAADAEEPPPTGRGRPAYGWRDVPRRRLEPHPEESRVVDLIVSHVLEGYTRPESVAALNALGLKTRYGKAWTRDSLRQVQHGLVRQGILRESRLRPYRPDQTDQQQGELSL